MRVTPETLESCGSALGEIHPSTTHSGGRWVTLLADSPAVARVALGAAVEQS